MKLLWDVLIGPFLAFLPLRWRKRLPNAGELDWTRAGTMSGMYEMAGAIVALGYWYMYEMNLRIAQILNGQETGTVHVGLTEHQIQGAALTVFALSPLTWFLFYLFFEGAVRLCGAAFAGNPLGSFPLYLTERLVFWIKKPQEARVSQRVRQHARSFTVAIRERLMVARLAPLPDEVVLGHDGDDELLDIRACRRKEDWIAPKVVRVGDNYYRLEDTSVSTGPRPFFYRLRRLPAGVPGRTVLVYKINEP